MPLPMVALPCGSRSTSSTRRPSCARLAARLTAVVVLPTPPFWLAIGEDAHARHAAFVSKHAGGARRSAPGTCELAPTSATRCARRDSRDLLERIHALSSRAARRRARQGAGLRRRNRRDRRRRARPRRRSVAAGCHASTRSHDDFDVREARARSPPAAGTRTSCGCESSSVTCRLGPRDRERDARASPAPLPTSSSVAPAEMRQQRRGCRAGAAAPSARVSRTAVRLCTRFHFSISAR